MFFQTQLCKYHDGGVIFRRVQTGIICPTCNENTKLKSYKQLYNLRTCWKCENQNVRGAYHFLCPGCTMSTERCAMCLTKWTVTSFEQQPRRLVDQLGSDMAQLYTRLTHFKKVIADNMVEFRKQLVPNETRQEAVAFLIVKIAQLAMYQVEHVHY